MKFENLLYIYIRCNGVREDNAKAVHNADVF
jgi:hypothetical protein